MLSRVTNAMTYSRSLQQLQDQLATQARASTQVATGHRYDSISDDPAAGGQIMRFDSASRGIAQYQRNITAIRAGFDGTESTLDQIGELLTRAKELATAQGGSNADAASRAATAAEVDSLLSQAVALGNLKIGDQYQFGGNATATAPFQPNGTYVGDNAVRQTEVDAGVLVNGPPNGQTLLMTSGVLQSLTTLRDALLTNNATGVRNVIANLDSAFDATQTNLAAVGASMNSLDATSASLTTRQTSITNGRAAVADIPIEEASLNLAAIQNALQAGLLATSKILNTSLVSYL